MDMGYSAMHMDVIKWDVIVELCPTEAAALVAVLDKHDIDSASFADCFRSDDPDPEELFIDAWLESKELGTQESNEFDIGQATAEVTDAWQALQVAFEKATRVGGSSLTRVLHFLEHADGRVAEPRAGK